MELKNPGFEGKLSKSKVAEAEVCQSELLPMM